MNLERIPSLLSLHAILASAPLLLNAGATLAADYRLTGDIGVGATHSQTQVRGVRAKTDAMPYLNFEYGPVFARIDTVGFKFLPFGYGHLELVGQYRGDGYKSTELSKRRDSAPLGLGTLQVTPIGAFEARVLRDPGNSDGDLAQARYIAELTFGRVAIYPEVGVEYQSNAYTGYYYGTTDAEATSLGQRYRPGSAVNSFVGAMVETRLFEQWYLNAYGRRTFVDNSISDSPLVTGRHRSTALVAVARRF